VAGSNRHRQFTTADRLLEQYFRDMTRAQGGPGWSAPKGGTSFTKGMHDVAISPDTLRGRPFNELTGD
jgi:hypothetical protein